MTAIQQALLGEVTPSLRAVTVSYELSQIHFECYFDGEISETEVEAMNCVDTELTAVFPATHTITHALYRRDYPELIPKEKIWVYYRKEI